MNIVFCADRRVLPGLHVAAYSLLQRMNPSVTQTDITVFSDALSDDDMTLLRLTLELTKIPFTLNMRGLNPSVFAGFPSLNGGWATYYRLFAAQVMDVERFLYLDVDTLCDIDVSRLHTLDLCDAPAGWVPEAPLAYAADRNVAKLLGNSNTDSYFNAGVILVNTVEWRRQRITELALEHLKNHIPAFWDQSALNCVLHRKAFTLDAKFNCIANMRKNWPFLKGSLGSIGRIIHFLDYPKPWDLMGEWIHPQYKLWREVLNQTAMKDFRSWQDTPTRKIPGPGDGFGGYKKALKDRALFAGYSGGWIKKVKGVVKE